MSHSLLKCFLEFTQDCSRYPIYGGMQDWNYIHGGCFELTLEITDNKWPPADEVLAKFNPSQIERSKIFVILLL